MTATERKVVKHRESGLTYGLTPVAGGQYLDCNDGRVPRGQRICWTREELRRVFEGVFGEAEDDR